MSDQIEDRSQSGKSESGDPVLKTDDLRKALAFLMEGSPHHDARSSKFVRLKYGSRSVGLASVKAGVGLGSRIQSRNATSLAKSSDDSDSSCCEIKHSVA